MGRPQLEKRAGLPLQMEKEGRKLYGYAAKFDSDSEDLGGFVERIQHGAFSRSLSGGSDVRCLVDHDTRLILGRRSAGTLRLWEDRTGLGVECDLPKGVSYADDLSILLERGDVNQFSFGFTVPPGGDSWARSKETGKALRTLETVSLVEVSVVAIPAYPSTEAGLRSLYANEVGRMKRIVEVLKLRRR